MPEVQSPAGVAAPDDEALVCQARQGDRAASEELFRRHRGVAYRVAYRYLGNEQDALDAAQDGFLKAFSGLEDFDGRSGFRTWLIRIVANAAIDLGRKRGRRAMLGMGVGFDPDAIRGERSSAPHEPAVHHDPADGLQRGDLRRALDAAIARLSPKLKLTFILFAEAEMSYKEIAEAQSIPIGTVMSRLSDARKRLQAAPELQGIELG
jgi:RNA polymerase sigma-70 factor, ECF subfamily